MPELKIKSIGEKAKPIIFFVCINFFLMCSGVTFALGYIKGPFYFEIIGLCGFASIFIMITILPKNIFDKNRLDGNKMVEKPFNHTHLTVVKKKGDVN